MKINEAQEISEAIRNQIYPPYKPEVLLEAALELCRNSAPPRHIIEVLAWALKMISMQNPSETTPDQKMAIVQLEYARKMPR